MNRYYAKQILEMNKENIKSIRFDTDWILSFDSTEKLGEAILIETKKKIDEIKEQNIELIKILANEK